MVILLVGTGKTNWKNEKQFVKCSIGKMTEQQNISLDVRDYLSLTEYGLLVPYLSWYLIYQSFHLQRREK